MSSENKEVEHRHNEGVSLRDEEVGHLLDQIRQQKPNLLENIPPEQQDDLVKYLMSYTSIEKHHSGPLPPPEMLNEYNHIVPDGANRIMLMAEKQIDHRMALEKKTVESQLWQSGAGQWIGFIITIIVLFMGFYLTILGHSGVGITMITTTLLGLVSIFVLGKKSSGSDKK
jgi:uncharacterized membrane protein